MKFYVVIDTNVLVSAMLRWNSVPGVVVDQALGGDIIPVLNENIIDEYEDVLHREKFRFDKSKVQALLEDIKHYGVLLNPAKVDEILADEKDVIFYAVTMEARRERDAYLVTGNIRHFPIRPYIVTPREMLSILQGEDV